MRRILLDQGLPPATAVLLRNEGWDAVHVREIHMRDAVDADILTLAAKESRVLFTLDRDFPELLALTGAVRPSVVLIRQQRLRTMELFLLITSVFRNNESALQSGCVLKVSARGTRVRLLPLR